MHILHLLQGQDEPLTVDEVAEGIGLHINTAREHLDRLVEGGFVSRESEIRKTRGRPRMLYRSVDRMAAATMDVRAREHLTRMLIEGYGQAMVSPAMSAEAEGRRWADELADAQVLAAPSSPPPAVGVTALDPVVLDPAVPGALDAPDPERPSSEETSAAVVGVAVDAQCPAAVEARAVLDADVLCVLPQPWEQLAALEQHFEDLGFDPEVDLATLQVHLRRCPLGDLAHQRTEIVCSVHLGLAQGVLARQGGTITAERLEPFVGPRHCVLYLRQG